MNTQQFSSQFDVLVSSYMRLRNFDDKEPHDTIEFNEYEKSLYLTKAQEEIVLNLYNGKNPYGEGFEQTEELRRYLSSLIVESKPDFIRNTSGNPIGMEGKNSYFFALPGSNEGEYPVWFITYEAVSISSEDVCKNGTTLEVVPVRQDEYHRIRKNPFRGANDRRALRLDLSDDVIEIICEYTVTAYYLRYLRKLKPIILTDLPNGLSIDGRNLLTDCEVHETLHQRILELAVQMALQSKGIPASREHKANNNTRE